MTTKRTKFRVSDTYKEIQWTTPIGCVEFKTGEIFTSTSPFETWGFFSWFYGGCIYAVINGKVNSGYKQLDCIKGRKILIRKINARINAKIKSDIMCSTEVH